MVSVSVVEELPILRKDNDIIFPMKCHFCQQDFLKDSVREFSFGDGEPILLIGNCLSCFEITNVRTITTANKQGKMIAAHLYVDKGNQNFHLLFHLTENYFAINWTNAPAHPTTGSIQVPQIYRVDFLPNITPQNVNEKLSTLLTFL